MAEKKEAVVEATPTPKKKEEVTITIVLVDGTREQLRESLSLSAAKTRAKIIGNEGFEKELEGGFAFFPSHRITRVTVKPVAE